jgi:transcriptional regulator with XRE-family HTH domain
MFKKLLANCGITQEELAEKLNVTQALISKWATKKCAPRTQMLPSIASILNVDVSVVVACFADQTEEDGEE